MGTNYINQFSLAKNIKLFKSHLQYHDLESVNHFLTLLQISSLSFDNYVAIFWTTSKTATPNLSLFYYSSVLQQNISQLWRYSSYTNCWVNIFTIKQQVTSLITFSHKKK